MKILKQEDGYTSKTNSEKVKYETDVKASLDNASPYQREVNNHLERLSVFLLKIQESEIKGEDTDELTQMAWEIVYELEKYGVTTKDRLDQNKDYWIDKAIEATKQIEKGEEVSVSFDSNELSDIYQIHTNDVSLKNQSQISYPCFPWPLTLLYCNNINIEWGGGSDSHAQQTLVLSGFVDMEGKICLENNGGHRVVIFTFNTEHDVYTLTNSHVFDEENGPANSYLSREGTCASYKETYSGISAVSGSIAHTEVHLNTNVSVRS